MHLYQLDLQNFKNYREERILLPGKITSLVGDNGAGKTNILDAIHYLSFSKSYFNVMDGYSVHHDENYCTVSGKFKTGPDRSDLTVHCFIRKGQRKVFKVNGKEVGRLADHIGRVPAVMVSPYDSVLIDGGSEERRRFLDMVISQFDKAYLEHLINYNRALLQRNALLKQMAMDFRFDPALLEIWDEQLTTHGQPVFAGRNAFVEELVPLFNQYYRHLSGEMEHSGLIYDSQLMHGTSMPDLLTHSLEKDRQARYTTAGAHKDDLKFTLSDVPVKRFGSQGQQKSFIVALKLAQCHLMYARTNLSPLLLLDDVFDKLDRSRIERLMELVSDPMFGQIVITDTNAERIHTIFRPLQAHTDIIRINNDQAIPLPPEPIMPTQ
jgi:DNA replication and repair protein RecF